MKTLSRRSLVWISGMVAVVVILMIINICMNGRYEVKVYDTSTNIPNTVATTTLTCEFSESSGFIKEEGTDYILHTAGQDKVGKSAPFIFTDLQTSKPLLDHGTKLQNGTEWVDQLITLNRSKDSILFADMIPGGNPHFYTLYPDLNVVVSQGSDLYPIAAPHRVAVSVASMGFCH